jgi:predicted regulator of Ras-like GTPase activity (Roadblock/LC7/MglB family)
VSTEQPLIEPGAPEATGGTDGLREILDGLNSSCKDIQLSMVTTHDGLTMVSLGSVLDPDRVGAMCSDLLSLCEKTAKELERGEVEQLLLKGKNGSMVVMPAGSHAVLAVMTRKDALLGMIFIESERAARLIQSAL